MGIKLIQTNNSNDIRGTVRESYSREKFAGIGIRDNFTDQLISESRHGVLRGIHFQKSPHFQSKLIRCISGEVFIAITDIRKSSRTFGKSVSITLSSGSNASIYIPKGFGIGFEVLSKENAIILYNISGKHSSEDATGIRWDSRLAGIKWPRSPKIMAEKDKNWPELNVDQ
jgi:dTDP-4-dehydrorhamnose 3,5-epimerase